MKEKGIITEFQKLFVLIWLIALGVTIALDVTVIFPSVRNDYFEPLTTNGKYLWGTLIFALHFSVIYCYKDIRKILKKTKK